MTAAPESSGSLAARALCDLESPICDLRLAVAIAWDQGHALLEGDDSEIKARQEKLFYAVQHALRAAENLEKLFYERWNQHAAATHRPA